MIEYSVWFGVWDLHN